MLFLVYCHVMSCRWSETCCVCVLVQVARVQTFVKVPTVLEQMQESGTFDLVLLRTWHECMTISLPVS